MCFGDYEKAPTGWMRIEAFDEKGIVPLPQVGPQGLAA